MRSPFSGFCAAVLGAIGQLAFCEGALGGAMILIALALVSPWAAAGAFFGALFGTALGAAGLVRTDGAWRHGLAGYNTAIVGLLSGGLAAEGAFLFPLFLALLGLCVALDEIFRCGLARVSLPVLSLPSMAVVIGASLVLAAPGTWFWVDTPAAPFGWPGLAAAAALAMGAMAIQSPGAAGWAIVLSALAYLGLAFSGYDPLAYGELWGLTIPLASFAVQAVFVRAPSLGMAGGAIAATAAAAIWLAWIGLDIRDVAPPLLVPFILGVWLALMLVRWQTPALLLQPPVWQAVHRLRAARASDRTPVAFVECTSPAEMAWGPRGSDGTPIEIDDQRLRDSARIRRAYWAACDELRRAQNLPETLHRMLATLVERGWLGAVITTDIHGCLRRAGVHRVVEIRGWLGRVVCIDCGMEGDWPPDILWQRHDPRCANCGGVLRPRPALWETAPAPTASPALDHLMSGCGALLVLGSNADSAWSRQVVARARMNGIPVIFISDMPISADRCLDDPVIHSAASRGLALVMALAHAPLPSWLAWPGRRSLRACI